MSGSREVHVVFGAGQIGVPLAQVLLRAGHEVRLVRRSAGTPPAGARLHTGDAGDPKFVEEVARGANVLYHCMNPPYSAGAWKRELPRWRKAMLAAAAKSGARIVLLDNLYLLGRPNGKKLSEGSVLLPHSRKGVIRMWEWQEWLNARHEYNVRVICGRASDFYGPGCTQSYFGDSFMPTALGSGVARWLTRLDTPHTYHYTLDVAAALAELGAAPDGDTGHGWWMLPAAPAVSTQTMLDLIGDALGTKLRVQTIPKLALKGLSLFVPILREVGEMDYQWNEPFVVDDSAFRTRFTTRATPLEQGVPAMAAWAREHYAARPQA